MSKLKDHIKQSKILNPIAHELLYKYQDVRDKFKESTVGQKVKEQQTIKTKTQPISDLKHTWAFNSGDTFSGNPKWLFLYVCKYRKDIDAYWLCDNEKTIAKIRSLGFHAYSFHSREGKRKQRITGVFCVEQVKEQIPVDMPKSMLLLNLYHGVGCKSIEKYVNFGFLTKRIAKKYISNNDYYYTNMLFLVTSPLMEEHFSKQLGLSSNNLIKAGYPRCMYQSLFEPVSTFDHDILKQKGLPEHTRIAAYVPTFRDDDTYDFWEHAVPDFDRLLRTLEREDILLIIKVHPQMLNDPTYKRISAKYKREKHLLFWNDANDFYEIFPKIDIGIIDYSSIYYDMLASGVKHFIRYFFDCDENAKHLRDFVFDPAEMTSGAMCENFDEFISALEQVDDSECSDNERILDLFWKYAAPDSFESIINKTMEFKPAAESGLPTLYSYDIFDTLFSRMVLRPEGIFYAVKYRIEQSGLSFPAYVVANYPKIRQYCEANVREYYSKSLPFRADDRREITYDLIFQRMQELYSLSDEQIRALMNWELEAELDNVVPCREMIDDLFEKKTRGEEVLLISDMYLDKAFITKLLHKADLRLAELPLFLSSAYGVQKTTGLLYLEAYLSEIPYQYKQWIHYGDNAFADGKCAESMGITPVLHEAPSLNDYEQLMVDSISTYDSYLVAASLSRFRTSNENEKDRFIYSFISLCFVPYISWVLDHAMAQGYETLYFISRDGYHLKRIADVIISEKKLSIKTKYIYGSRSAWRIPSFTDHVDIEFFSDAGAFGQINTYAALLDAMQVSDKEFSELFPQHDDLRKSSLIPLKAKEAVIRSAKVNKDYHALLLEKAEKARPIVLDYLRQEIDFNENFAFVEYWGRGYTQTCFTRLLCLASENPAFSDPFYYARTIYPTIGQDIRYNFTGNNNSLIFVEAVFANMPYKTITTYKQDGDRIVPVIKKRECDIELFEGMKRLLPAFALEYCRLEFLDRERTTRELFDFALSYYHDHTDDPHLCEFIGSLVDAVGVYGTPRPFAPPVTGEMINRIYQGESPALLTSSFEMTKARSTPRMAEKFEYLTVTRKKR